MHQGKTSTLPALVQGKEAPCYLCSNINEKAFASKMDPELKYLFGELISPLQHVHSTCHKSQTPHQLASRGKKHPVVSASRFAKEPMPFSGKMP